MDWYEPEVKALEAAAPPPAGATLFYGSSTIRLWEGLKDDFPTCPVINRGFGGATLAACVYFFERLVPPVSPGSLVLYAGDNDIGDGQPAESVVASYLQFQDKVHRLLGSVRFTFISIKPSPARWHLVDRIRAVNDRVRREPVNFIDVYPRMMGADGRPNATLFLEDGLHMSEAGYAVWKSVLIANQNTIFTECSSPIIPRG